MNITDAVKEYHAFKRRKEEQVQTARIPGYRTVGSSSLLVRDPLRSWSEPWAYKLFGGPFYGVDKDGSSSLPAVNLVFVQSADGNTDTASGNPADLQGGNTDLHLIYEGLSRVMVDAVLAGAGTIRNSVIVFSVWHPKLVAWRTSQGKSRHPAQIVVTGTGAINVEEELMFNLPHLSVFVLTTNEGAGRLAGSLSDRPQVTLVSTGSSLDLRKGLELLRAHHRIRSISAVGGRTTASALFDQGLVDDLYLTTAAVPGGTPHTPYYVGTKGLPAMRLVLEKEGSGEEQGVKFQHFQVMN